MSLAANLPPGEKRVLLARLLSDRAKRPQEHPVSFGQQRLWFLDRLEPAANAYIMPTALRLRGAMDIRAFEASLLEVGRRHAILRTTISDVDGEPVQLVHPSMTLVPKVLDLSEIVEDQRERCMRQCLMEEVRHPFDLAAGPLCRVCVLRLAEDEHIVLVNLHHIVTDGWSTAILIRELVTFYQAALVGEPSPLQALPIQYADYARWQRNWLQGAGFAAEMSYWRRQLGGQLPKLELPTDYVRPVTQDYTGASYNRILDKRTAEALSTLARRERATLFMLLLAALKTLLYRHTGQADLAVGTVVSGRQRAELEPLIGFFVNTLVLRTDVSGGPRFLEVLRRVKEVSLGALSNQSVPFEKLVEELNPQRNLNKNPLFDIMFNFGNMPGATAATAGLSLSPVELAGAQARQAITLYADESKGHIALSLVYQSALFSAERMRVLLLQYVYLLEQIIAAPDEPIDWYSLCIPETQHQLPDPRVPLAVIAYEPVTETFRRWVERTPEAPAVRQLRSEFTYRQLGERADAISRCLVAAGLRRGETVAVLGPRSFGLIAGIIAAMQVGGVLLLIDRTHPENRRIQLLTEGRARQVIAVWENDASERELADCAGIPVTRIWAADGGIIDDAHEQALHPQLRPRAEDPAYICFTSGSTGIPKGVLCSHRGLAHFISWEIEELGVSPADRVAQLSRLSFEPTMRDIFVPLTSGATLCLPPDQTQFDTSQILAWLEQESVSLIHIVPAVAQLSLASVSPEITLRSLRWALFAGETLTEPLVRRWRESFPGSGEIANLYGPTETTLAKFCYHVPYPPPPGIQPVGRPLPHTQALVVNAGGRLCGIGEPGQIVLRTPYRSLRYINLTQSQGDKFVANPYRDDPNDLFYYTGDYGKYRVDGLLEVQGRRDWQVKIGGVRIELGEIESVIVGHPDVGACVVTVRGRSEEDQRLVAYLTARPGASVSIKSVGALLQRELPKYQHPSHFVILDRLPLMPNGKLDRNALPEPGTQRPDTHEPYVAPRNAVELKLSRMWEGLLNISPIGVCDSFFELGGHSMLAVRLMSQIDQAFGKSLPLALLFEGATIEKLACCLDDALGRGSAPLVAIQPLGPRRPLFFVHPAGGNVLCYFTLANRLGKERPFYGLQSPGLDLDRPLPERIEQMATLYIESIVTVQSSGPYLLGGWSMGAIVAYEMAQQLLRRGQQVALLALLDHRPPESGDTSDVQDEAYVMQQFFDGAVELDSSSMQLMSAGERLDYYVKHMTRLKLMPPDVGEAQLGLYLKGYFRNVKALRRYSAGPYPGRITVLRTRSEIIEADDALGWGQLGGGVEVFEVPGKHSDMVSEPHVGVLAQILNECMVRAEAAAG